MVDVGEDGAREPRALGADHEDRRAQQLGRVQRLAAVGGEPVQRGRQLVKHVGERDLWEHRHAEERAHAGADRLGAVGVGRTRRGHEGGGAEGDRRPDQRADIAGVLDAVEVHDQHVIGGATPGPGQRRQRPPLRQWEHRHRLSRRLQRGDARRDALAHGEDGGRRGGGRRRSGAQPGEAEALAELVRGLLTQEDRLRPPAGRQCGRDHVGAFRQEGAFAIAELALAQRRRPLDEGVLRAGQWCAENPKRLAFPGQAVRPLRGPSAPGRRATRSTSGRSRRGRRGSCGRARSRRAADHA